MRGLRGVRRAGLAFEVEKAGARPSLAHAGYRLTPKHISLGRFRKKTTKESAAATDKLFSALQKQGVKDVGLTGRCSPCQASGLTVLLICPLLGKGVNCRQFAHWTTFFSAQLVV